jgi:hypothetical protein
MISTLWNIALRMTGRPGALRRASAISSSATRTSASAVPRVGRSHLGSTWRPKIGSEFHNRLLMVIGTSRIFASPRLPGTSGSGR